MKRLITVVAVVLMAGFSGLAHGDGYLDLDDGKIAVNAPSGFIYTTADTVYTNSINLTGSISAGDSLRFVASDTGYRQDRTVLSTNAAYLVLTSALNSAAQQFDGAPETVLLMFADKRFQLWDTFGNLVSYVDATADTDASRTYHYREMYVETPVEQLDADDTLTADQTGLFSIYRPLTAKRTATLPTAAAGLGFEFMVADTDSLLIAAASGDSLITSAGVAYKTTTSVAGTIRLKAMDATRWIILYTLGTWTSY